MPFQVLIALITTSWLWGWKKEAAVFALAWGALLRIGEVLAATRRDLILPDDVGNTVDFILLRIAEPKTRYSAARHQAGKLEQADLIQVVRFGFKELKNHERLWPFSGSTLRLRLSKLLERFGLPSKDQPRQKALSLASLRPGGATWLMGVCESAEVVRRRGRWASFKTMEIYLQEVMSVTFLNDISKESRDRILVAVELFPLVFLQVKQFIFASIPETTWYFLLSRGQVTDFS